MTVVARSGRQGCAYEQQVQDVLKRIKVADARVGMFIQEFCGSWMDHPFWKTRFLLDNDRDLQRIRDSAVSEIWIDTARGFDVLSGEAETEAEVQQRTEALLASVQTQSTQPKATLAAELEQAKRLCARSKQAVVEMFNAARMGQSLEIHGVYQLVEEISDSMLRHPDALISLARLKTADEYTYMHSVAVSALMISLARQLELPDREVRQAGMAGLLHDVGKMQVPLEVLNKPGKLTDAEFAQVREHPLAGFKLLQDREVSEQVLDVCLHHHEKVDGSGYPHRLRADQISLQAKMGAVCDVYDAITSDRPYKKGWDPADAIRRMAEWQGHFDPRVFQAFVRSVGIYPVGSLVRLKSGRLAVVLEQNPHSLLAPKVKVFFSTLSSTPLLPSVIDLAKPANVDKIIARENPENWNFPFLNQLWSGLEPRKGSYFD